ncbi:Carboxy-S-adenosyl-L-methionine synthase [Vibrio hippocampi]|uniref:Carboxy-S-adenosyl-L-methionine synthase n=2 Tax=Vibrio hippocampi TaxID=654686 RepID=A0ABM8ZLV6_9VIBR|nr:Carboxy-S-adenosyl-L-methionine synthase [Vibrio hippocampi]
MGTYFDGQASNWDECPLKLERAQITANKIKKIAFHSHESIVDFGCGTGLLGLQFYNEFQQVHLVDASSKMLDKAKAKIDAAKIDNTEIHNISSISELKSEHSVIMTLMTLHHIEDTKEFLFNAFNKLEENGCLIIADLFKEDGAFHKHNPNFVGHNGFDVEHLTELAKNVGFSVEQCGRYYEIWQENYEGIKIEYPLFLFVARKIS